MVVVAHCFHAIGLGGFNCHDTGERIGTVYLHLVLMGIMEYFLEQHQSGPFHRGWFYLSQDSNQNDEEWIWITLLSPHEH